MKKFFEWIPAFAGITRKLPFRTQSGIHFFLILIIFIGGFLRFYHVNWDSFGAFHPDERNISWAVTRIHFFDQLNPKFFAYGGLPIYLYRALGESVVYITKDPNWLFDWGHIAVIGRSVSATLSTISVGLIFLVGATYFSPLVGLLSAALLAISPWAIEQAHFSTTETMLVFFTLLILLVSHKFIRSNTTKQNNIDQSTNWRMVGLVGFIWGLATAAKTTALLFGVIPFTALWIPHTFSLPDKKQQLRNFVVSIKKKLLQTTLLLMIAMGTCFLLSPYTILDFKHFNESMMYESGVALGRFTVPYTLQFLHTTPYLYQLVTMLWQTGPLVIVGLVGLLAMVIATTRNGVSFRSIVTALASKRLWKMHGLDLDDTRITTRRARQNMIIFLIFPIVYFGWVGTWFAKFARYNVLFLPFLTIAAAWLMVSSLKNNSKKGLYWFIEFFVYLIIGLLTVVWGVANFTIYLRPQTKVEATHWILDHIPTNAKIYTEHWNDGLPLDLPNSPSYHRELLTVYDEPDNDTKRRYYADKLSAGDYIILSTRRIWATMPRLQEKYPVTSMFYKKLLNAALGYTEVAAFTSYPQLLGITINDDTAEESLQVFDHPTVRIFQNTGHYSKEEIYKLLMSSMGS